MQGRPFAAHVIRGRRDRGVVVEDRQQQGLEDDGVGEGRLDDHQRRVREVGLALGIAPDVAREAVAGQPLERGLVDDVAVAQGGDRRVVEGELLDRVERSLHTGHHAVPTSFGEPAGEELEHGTSVRSARGKGGLHHGELVVVGEQCGRHPAHPTGGPRHLG
jgi:hypothetical protein